MNSYRRFSELKNRAKNHLKSGSNDENLRNAMIEIGYLRKDEVPNWFWSEIESIQQAGRKHKAIRDEGTIMASISKMSFQEKTQLKEKILRL